MMIANEVEVKKRHAFFKSLEGIGLWKNKVMAFQIATLGKVKCKLQPVWRRNVDKPLEASTNCYVYLGGDG